MKEKFIELLRQSGKEGIGTIIANLEKLGFFEAPASTRFHLAVKGGLCQHSVSVCETAIRLREVAIMEKPELEAALPLGSVIFASLLHDVCKAEIYKQGFRNVKNEKTGVWEKVTVYETDYTKCPLGHGEKSVIRLLRWGIDLTEDEILAIRWHMSAWDIPFQSYEALGNLNEAKNKCPLVVLLQAADGLSSCLFE